MLFEVRGTRGTDGKRMKAIVRATDLNTAILKASKHGLQVESASMVKEAQPEPSSIAADGGSATRGQSSDDPRAETMTGVRRPRLRTWGLALMALLVCLCSLAMFRAWSSSTATVGLTPPGEATSRGPIDTEAAHTEVTASVAQADAAATAAQIEAAARAARTEATEKAARAAAAAEAAMAPLELHVASNVDEALFLVRVVGNLYDNWPSSLDSASTAAWVIDQRLTFERLHTQAQSKKLDIEIINALDETVGVCRRYDDYLVEIGAANRDTLARAARERGELFDAGINTLADQDPRRYQSDGGTTQAVKDVALTGLVGVFVDLYQQKERDEAQQQRKEAAERSFSAYRDSTRLGAARAATRLMAKHGWMPGEIGFENIGNPEQVRRRPRDPFVIRRNAEIRQAGEKAVDIARDASACVRAASLVPEGAVYDVFRAEMLISASRLSKSASLAAWFEDGSHSYGSPVARTGVRICRTRLLYDPDLSDRGKYELAACLNVAGRHDEALRVAADAKGQFNDSGFAYDVACFSSLNGLTKQSLDWLERALSLGASNVQWYKQDPELAQMRTEHATEFGALMEVKVSGRIVWGVFNDDYVVTNDSKYALTNVKVRPIIVRKDRRTYKDLAAARIAPGESYKWENVFSISSDEYVRMEFGEWSCDQKP